MRYLCLFYFDRELVNAGSKEEWAEIDANSLATNERLKKSGHYIVSNALAEPETALSIRSRGGKVLVSDGPFVETKEHLGGFMLVEARDLNEAMSLVQDSPLARMGGIEIRATTDFG